MRRQRPTFTFVLALLAANVFAQDAVPLPVVAPSSPAQFKAMARASFAQGDAPQGREHLAALLRYYRQVSTADQSSPARYQWSARLAEVAQEYLRAGELPSAMEVLGEAADLNVPLRNEYDNGLQGAAAGLHRQLAQLDADERFEVLHAWSLPAESRRNVRVLRSFVPTDAPPTVFARELGERPRETSFPIAAVGEVEGLFSTAWSLVQAADEAGRLTRLRQELAELAGQQVAGADAVLMLALIVDTADRDKQLVEKIQQRVDELKHQLANEPPQATSDPLVDVVLAAACLERDWLQPIGEDILQPLMEDTYTSESWVIRPLLRRVQATAIRKRYPGASAELFTDSGLRHWISASGYNSVQSARGAPRPVWLAQEDHILHVTGPRNDALLFRYPLIGDFEFSCEAQDGGRDGTEGGVTYGGLGYEAWGAGQSFKVWDADFRFEVLRLCPFVRVERGQAAFNRLSLSSTGEGVTFSSNGHPVWSDTSNDRSSPWIGLRCFNDRRPIFRNLKLTGTPVVPREVPLVARDRLAGWLAAYYNETVPTPLPEANRRSSYAALPPAANDWFAANGILHGARRDEDTEGGAQSRLSYFRPLLDGESISYEFQYEPDRFEVHPTLGRLAFLIGPDGVRLHWMTNGGREWTGLAEDNAIVEPLNRRGPRPLPLKPGEWNRMTLKRADGKAMLSLNDTTIYERDIEAESDHRFGFYHDRHRSAVRVRNVVMRGDWPEQLRDGLRANLAATNGDRPRSVRHAVNAMFGDSFVAENVFALRERIASMPRDDRYDALVDWVLPGKHHPTFRLSGEFTSTHPVPFLQDGDVADQLRLQHAAEAGTRRVELGGNLVAPVFDLIRLATELGRLDELHTQVEKSAVDDEATERARAALLLIINLAREDFDGASTGFEQLLTLGEEINHAQRVTCWPEALAASRGIVHAETREIATELLRSVYFPQLGIWQKDGSEPWHDYVAALSGLRGYLELEETSVEQFWTAPSLQYWSPVSFTNCRTRGEGRTRAAWHRRGSRVDNNAGHEQDYLFYRIPLRGNYEVECDVTAFGWRESHLMVAGTVVAPAYLKLYGVGDFRKVTKSGKIEPMLAKVDNWIRYRTVVRDGVSTTYFNGRKIHEQPLAEEHDPWLAIRSWSRHQGSVRDLRISGSPVVPTEIQLSARPDLPGWASYFGTTVGEADSEWHQLGDGSAGGGIVARAWRDVAGGGLQRLLRYHRPMIEDGTIEYEFYYATGEVAVHPALDRLAFMLEPAGVRIHWITDGKFDRTGLSPVNLFDEPANRRAEGELPLKSNDWNRLRLTLRGDTVELQLNDQLVYQRELEPTNQRTFGLFRYADQTEARVRNIVWRGDWPREVPTVGEQELAGEMADFIDHRVPELTSAFEHDFTKHGLSEKYFTYYGNGAEQFIAASDDGVQVTRPGVGVWSQASFGPRFRARGDFDLTASFDRLETQNATTCNIMLLAILESEISHHCRITRVHHDNGRQTINGQLMTVTPDGGRRTRASQQTCEADSGRLRIARRGDMIYHLFAEGDSPIFRIIGTEQATTDDVRSNGVRLVASAGEGAQANVLWKHLTLRAEQLMFIPQELEKPVLFVMSADGQQVRQLTRPIGARGSHGSPAWSPDGRRVAFDTFNGSTTTSHIYIINADGSGLKDLGIGSMPTFSPDGKRIAISWAGEGIAVMNVDGTNRKVLDPSGWGAQWSPDGKSIAYGSRNITILDLATKNRRTILEGEQARRYSYIYWNMAWSLDSRRICFLGRTRDGKYESSITDVAGSSRDFRVLHNLDTQPHADFSWHPNGKQILCSLPNPQREGSRLFTLEVDNPGPPVLLATQPLDQRNTSADWSRDGKYVVFTSQPIPVWESPAPKTGGEN